MKLSEKTIAKICFITVAVILGISLFSEYVLSDDNVSIMYGWNGAIFVPLLTETDGTLKTNIDMLNVTVGNMTVQSGRLCDGSVGACYSIADLNASAEAVTDTNETIRVDNLAGQSCPANQFVDSYAIDLSPSCSAPSFTDTWWSLSFMLINNSNILQLNMSWINATIDARENHTDLFYPDTNETTRMNNIASYTCTGSDKISSFAYNSTPVCTTDQDTTYSESDMYLYIIGTVFYINESNLNMTIDARENHTDLFYPDTVWTLFSPHLYNNSGNLAINETWLNSTIDSRDQDTTYTEDDQYLMLTGTVFSIDEAELNSTIDDRSGSASFISNINVSVSSYTGNITNGSLVGYQAMHDICNTDYPGSRLCTSDDIIYLVSAINISYFNDLTSAWIGEGAPGYLASANDCEGYTSPTSTKLGAFWDFDTTGGGMGWLVNCANSKPLACCW